MLQNRGRGRCGSVEDGKRSCAAPPCPRVQVCVAVEEGGRERWRLRHQSSSAWASNARRGGRGGRRPRRRASGSRRGSSACGRRSQAGRRRGDVLLGEVGGAVLPADDLGNGGEDLRCRRGEGRRRGRAGAYGSAGVECAQALGRRIGQGMGQENGRGVGGWGGGRWGTGSLPIKCFLDAGRAEPAVPIDKNRAVYREVITKTWCPNPCR